MPIWENLFPWLRYQFVYDNNFRNDVSGFCWMIHSETCIIGSVQLTKSEFMVCTGNCFTESMSGKSSSMFRAIEHHTAHTMGPILYKWQVQNSSPKPMLPLSWKPIIRPNQEIFWILLLQNHPVPQRNTVYFHVECWFLSIQKTQRENQTCVPLY